MTLSAPTSVVSPGQSLPVSIRFEAHEAARDIAWVRLHLHMTFASWGQNTLGLLELQRQKRDVESPVMLAERFVLAAWQLRDSTINVTVPQGLPPSIPGQVEYAVYVVAPVAGQVVDTNNSLPLTVVHHGVSLAAPGGATVVPGAGAVPAPPPVAVPTEGPSALVAATASAPASYAPGSDVEAIDPKGEWACAMVVQRQGVMLFVQWSDGRAAM